jgi:hypothetical protein
VSRALSSQHTASLFLCPSRPLASSSATSNLCAATLPFLVLAGNWPIGRRRAVMLAFSSIFRHWKELIVLRIQRVKGSASQVTVRPRNRRRSASADGPHLKFGRGASTSPFRRSSSFRHQGQIFFPLTAIESNTIPHPKLYRQDNRFGTTGKSGGRVPLLLMLTEKVLCFHLNVHSCRLLACCSYKVHKYILLLRR